MLDIPAFNADKQKRSGKALILLLEIEYADGQFIRYARYNVPVVFEGVTWTPFPILGVVTSQTLSGEIPAFDIGVSGVGREIVAILESVRVDGRPGLGNRPGRIVRVHPDHLDDPTAKKVEPFTIVSVRVRGRDCIITVSPVTFDPLDVMLPRKKVSSDEFPGILGARGRFL